eukprot:10396891-Karenia_brevis.AAC.1
MAKNLERKRLPAGVPGEDGKAQVGNSSSPVVTKTEMGMATKAGMATNSGMATKKDAQNWWRNQ